MNFVALIEALAFLAWPVIVGVLGIKIYPAIQEILKSRSLHIKVGNNEFTVQDSTDKLRRQINDLQNQVIDLRGGSAAENFHAQPQSDPVHRHLKDEGKLILWIDDNPEAIAFERTKFEEDGYRIHQVTSTSDALNRLRTGPNPDVIVSDMGRIEDGVRISDAGLKFLKAAREEGVKIPVFIFTSVNSAQIYRQEAEEAGANGITSSSVSLIQFVRGSVSNN